MKKQNRIYTIKNLIKNDIFKEIVLLLNPMLKFY